MMFRAMWDATRPGQKTAEGWIHWDHIVSVERCSRDRLTDHGQTIAVPAAVVTLANSTVATVEGPDAVRLFRACELQTRYEPGSLPNLAG